MMYSNNHMTSAGWVFLALGTLIVLALLVAAIVWLLATLRSPGSGSPSARETLDRRLASGELSVAQHAEIASAIGDRPGPATPIEPPASRSALKRSARAEPTPQRR